MAGANVTCDALVIGGGFYGTAIAVYLVRQRGLKRVVLAERQRELLSRASYSNQARVHNGYHYPRSFTTAYRSRVNLPRFVMDWPDAIKQDFVKLYAIARRNSKVTARQFHRFCGEIGARIEPADAALRGLFEPRLIEDVFLVQEYAFDTGKLAEWALRELRECDVEIRTESRVRTIMRGQNGWLSATLDMPGQERDIVHCRYAFNCTYSGLNQIAGDFPQTRAGLTGC